MPEKDRQISVRIPPKTYEDFAFICMMKKSKMATEIKNSIERFINENSKILKHDSTHYQILVEENGRREWIEVTETEEKRDYENIGTDGKAIFKRKVKN